MSDATEIAKARYARGEISKEELANILQTLGADQASATDYPGDAVSMAATYKMHRMASFVVVGLGVLLLLNIPQLNTPLMWALLIFGVIAWMIVATLKYTPEGREFSKKHALK